MLARSRWSRFQGALLGVLALLALAAPASSAAPGHGRAWELVSAGETHGTQFSFSRAWSGDGEQMVFVTLGPLPGAVSGELLSHNLATRTADGWRVTPVSVPHTTPGVRLFGSVAMAVSSDFSRWLWGSVNPLLPGAPENPLLGLYRREPGGAISLLGSLGQETTFFAPTTASADLGNVGFDSREALVPADSGRIAGSAAYEVAGDELRLVGVDESGQPTSPCGSTVGDRTQDLQTRATAMSRDGSRVFFTSPDPFASGCATPTAVYLREDGAHTIEISASQCTRADCGPAAPASFAGASADGSTAYLVSAQQLTDDDVDAVADLYRYDRASGTLTRVSAGPPGTAANVIPPVRLSADGSRVYFRATGSLVPGESREETGNLYMRTGDGPLHFVGNISGQSLGNASVSADGGVLLFASNVALLAGDTDTAADVYRYDAASGALAHLSASSGGGDSGNGEVNAILPSGEEVFPANGPSPLSADGARAFFLSPEALLAADENDEPDIYEWAGGGLGLVTSGAAGLKAITYEGASGDGSSVFFETRETLVPGDSDGGEGDLYVARLGGGFPPPPVAPACSGEACRGAAPGRLSPLSPASGSAAPEAGLPQPRQVLRLRLGARARQLLAGGKRALAVARVPAAGHVRLSAFAPLDGREALVASAAALAWRPGKLALPLRLRPAARDLLAQRGRLRLRLVLAHSQVPAERKATVTLRRPR